MRHQATGILCCLIALPLAAALGQMPGGAPAATPAGEPRETRVTVESEQWQLVGELVQPPASAAPAPAVLLLNKVAGTRAVYAPLARELARRGIASLRLDLRAHGESTNRGRFVPGAEGAIELLSGTERDVAAGLGYLARTAGIDPARLAVVGASYSGEAAVVAGGPERPVKAYVLLSPGSLSASSVQRLESQAVPWLFVASRAEGSMKSIRPMVLESGPGADVLLLAGPATHATDLLEAHPALGEQIAAWLAARLR